MLGTAIVATCLACAACSTGKSGERSRENVVVEEYDGGEKEVEYAVVERNDERLRHGTYERWHENGQKHVEGSYRDDKPDGRWRFWLPNGDLYAENTYDADEHERVDQDVKLSIFETMEELGPVNFCEPDELRAPVDAHQDDIDDCFRKHGDGQGAPEELNYSWTVGLSGEVFESEVAEEEEADSELVRCHRDIIEDLRWEPPVGGECKVDFKFQCKGCD